MKEFICIICPRGCRLQADPDTLTVTGNKCKRGVPYALSELQNPVRTLTATVEIEGGIHARLPIRSTTPISKDRILDCMTVIKKTLVKSPVSTGDVVIADICGTGSDMIATRDL